MIKVVLLSQLVTEEALHGMKNLAWKNRRNQVFTSERLKLRDVDMDPVYFYFFSKVCTIDFIRRCKLA